MEGKLEGKLLDGVVLEAEAVAKKQLIVLLWSVVVEELFVGSEIGAIETAEGEGLMRLKVPFYLGGNGVIEDVDDWEKNWNSLDIW